MISIAFLTFALLVLIVPDKTIVKAFKNTALTIKCTAGILHNESRLVAYGSNVKFSEFIYTSTFSENVWTDSCNGSNVKQLLVFSNNLLEIDKDLLADDLQLQVSLIAPIWRIRSKNQNISVSGKNANHFSNNPAAEVGEPGKTGLTGSNAGEFLGIYLNITYSENSHLSIYGVGGNGGNGQTGGRGLRGLPGRPAESEDISGAVSISYSYGTHINFLKPGGIYKGCIKHHKLHQCSGSWYTKIGDEGGPGRTGAKGGTGGQGGRGGNVVLWNSAKQMILDSSNKCNYASTDNITVYCHDGHPGQPGKGGEGGPGGYYGDHISCPAGYYRRCSHTVNYREGMRGNLGVAGDKVIRRHKQRSLHFNFWRDIIAYKSIYFDDLLANETFVTMIDSNIDMFHTYTPMAIATEFLTIQDKYLNSPSNNQKGMIEVLNRQLEKIKMYTSRKIRERKISNTDKLALNHIFASVIGQIISVKDSEDNANVINPAAYFNLIFESLGEIEEAQTLKIANEERNKYKNDLDSKAKGVLELIQTVVQPALDDAERLLDNKTNVMLQEMEERILDAELNVDKIRAQKARHESAWTERILLGSLRVVAVAAAFIPAVGPAIGGLIGGGVQLYETLKPKSEDIPIKPQFPSISFDFNKLGDSVKKTLDDKIENSKFILEEANKLVNENTQFLEDLKPKVAEFEERITKFMVVQTIGEVPDVWKGEIELDKVSTQLEEAMDAKGKLLEERDKVLVSLPENKAAASEAEENFQSKSKIDSDFISDAIKRIKTMIQLSQSGFDLAHIFNSHNKKSRQFERMIQNATENVKRAEKLRLSMYKQLIPLMSSMSKDLGKGLDGKSKAGLNVKQWQVQSSLGELRRTITAYTKNMKISEELQLCIDKIQEAVLLLIKLYEVIDSYEEKKQFADYMGNILSSSTLTHSLKDPELITAINEMRLGVSRSVFQERYNKALHTFKKWVFPFAKQYLDVDMNFTVHSLVNSSIETIGVLYQEKVSKLHYYLQQYNATTTGRDEVLLVTNFSSFTSGSVPFFTWENEQWRNSIRDFFSGKPIQLFASLDNFATKNGKSAIKFRTIAFMVRAKTKESQPEVDRLMGHFHVKYTHSGISKYYLGHKEYIIYDRNVTYINSFEKSRNGFITSNYALAKQAERGDFLLSPYTMWTVQLYDALPLAGLGFAHLEALVDKVDLTLEGTGLYIDECILDKSVINRLHMESHYEPTEENSTILTAC